VVDKPTIDEQELRVAVVMKGGVSLAVWMGGVTRELDRLRRDDGAYAAIAGLTRSLPRVDVIAGSSAGGINGAVLAVAIARRSDVAPIRDIWMNAGSIGDLLRDPMQREAPSLFYGDRKLLAALGSALTEVAGDGDADAAGDDPLHLTVTGTMLEGEVKAYADHFGAVIPDVDHRARFVFRRGHVGEVPEADEPWPDTFTGPAVLSQIALAARSSSSFPVAFEPSFCPVGKAGTDPAIHPDMDGPANFTQSRWVIDGGVLVNTPFRPALDAVATLAADRSVRRILAYVVPHPVATTPEPDKPQDLPTALEVAMDAGAGSRASSRSAESSRRSRRTTSASRSAGAHGPARWTR
jgi:patatin-related protein